MVDDSSDESDHNNDKATCPYCYIIMTSDEQEMSEHVANNTPVNEADCSNGISGLL